MKRSLAPILHVASACFSAAGQAPSSQTAAAGVIPTREESTATANAARLRLLSDTGRILPKSVLPDSAGFNLNGESNSGSITTKFFSDTPWKASPQAPEGRRAVKFDDRGWLRAARKTYPLQIIQPNFDTGRLSWIERWRRLNYGRRIERLFPTEVTGSNGKRELFLLYYSQ